MQLVSVGTWGYRRFRKDHPNMDVAGKVIAIVGPNEAGKTSFLRAMLHLDSAEAFERNELTRRSNGKAAVRAVFSLEDADREALADLHGGTSARTFTMWRIQTGSVGARIEPPLTRDTRPRAKLLSEVRRVVEQKWARENTGLASSLRSLQAGLETSDETLDTAVIDHFQQVRDECHATEDVPRSIRNFGARLERLIEAERTTRPEDDGVARLLERRPEFLFFADEHRELAPVHDINADPSVALRNLLALASLRLRPLRDAINANDQATVEELLVAANARLREVFETSWSQASITVHLRVTQAELHVFVSSAPGRFMSIAERSDGLRQFVALIAYVERFASRDNLVLLIDEAETHLHYDAQADLVRVLTNQTIAGKVIYTTHSAGCLPEDLGLGVRLIEPEGDPAVDPAEWEHSRVQNWFWSPREDAGALSPLLIGMGASTFAFSATRYALVAEGISDAMVLPSLFREAADVANVGFQVAPGLAEASPEALAAFDLTAARVAYLVDSDDDGEMLRRRLIDAHVPAARILRLGRTRQGLSLEDLIERSIYIQAVSEELLDRHNLQIPASAIPDRGRARAVATWCRRHRRADGEPVEISKRAVAHRVLDQRFEQPLLATSRRKMLRTLHTNILKLLCCEDRSPLSSD